MLMPKILSFATCSIGALQMNLDKTLFFLLIKFKVAREVHRIIKKNIDNDKEYFQVYWMFLALSR